MIGVRGDGDGADRRRLRRAVVALLATLQLTGCTLATDQAVSADAAPPPTADSIGAGRAAGPRGGVPLGSSTTTATTPPASAETTPPPATPTPPATSSAPPTAEPPAVAPPAPAPPAPAPPAPEPAPVAPAPAPVGTDAVEAQLVALTNRARADAGLPALTRVGAIDTVARTWSQHLASTGATLSHNPSYSSQIPSGWTSAAENVAWVNDHGTMSDAEIAATIHDGWMNSAGHRANILGDVTSIGVGVAHDPTHGWYATQNFGRY